MILVGTGVPGDFELLVRYFQCVCSVEGQVMAAVDGAALDRRIFHSRQDNIDAVGWWQSGISGTKREPSR